MDSNIHQDGHNKVYTDEIELQLKGVQQQAQQQGWYDLPKEEFQAKCQQEIKMRISKIRTDLESGDLALNKHGSNKLNNGPIIENKPNYLDPLVWKVGLDSYDGPDRKVSYWKQKTSSFIFYGNGPVDLSIDYDLKFYSKRLQESGLKKYDFIPNDSGSPLVSRRVVDRLKELCPDEFQAIPAKIGKEDKETGEYIAFNIECYLINLLKYVDCVDRDRSTYDCFVNVPSTISYVKKLFFLPNCLQNYMMARAKELTSLIVVSSEFAKIFTSPPYYGGFFRTPEECYNALYNGNYWEKKE